MVRTNILPLSRSINASPATAAAATAPLSQHTQPTTTGIDPPTVDWREQEQARRLHQNVLARKCQQELDSLSASEQLAVARQREKGMEEEEEEVAQRVREQVLDSQMEEEVVPFQAPFGGKASSLPESGVSTSSRCNQPETTISMIRASSPKNGQTTLLNNVATPSRSTSLPLPHPSSMFESPFLSPSDTNDPHQLHHIPGQQPHFSATNSSSVSFSTSQLIGSQSLSNSSSPCVRSQCAASSQVADSASNCPSAISKLFRTTSAPVQASSKNETGKEANYTASTSTGIISSEPSLIVIPPSSTTPSTPFSTPSQLIRKSADKIKHQEEYRKNRQQLLNPLRSIQKPPVPTFDAAPITTSSSTSSSSSIPPQRNGKGLTLQTSNKFVPTPVTSSLGAPSHSLERTQSTAPSIHSAVPNQSPMTESQSRSFTALPNSNFAVRSGTPVGNVTHQSNGVLSSKKPVDKPTSSVRRSKEELERDRDDAYRRLYNQFIGVAVSREDVSKISKNDMKIMLKSNGVPWKGRTKNDSSVVDDIMKLLQQNKLKHPDAVISLTNGTSHSQTTSSSSLAVFKSTIFQPRKRDANSFMSFTQPVSFEDDKDEEMIDSAARHSFSQEEDSYTLPPTKRLKLQNGANSLPFTVASKANGVNETSQPKLTFDYGNRAPFFHSAAANTFSTSQSQLHIPHSLSSHSASFSAIDTIGCVPEWFAPTCQSNPLSTDLALPRYSRPLIPTGFFQLHVGMEIIISVQEYLKFSARHRFCLDQLRSFVIQCPEMLNSPLRASSQPIQTQSILELSRNEGRFGLIRGKLLSFVPLLASDYKASARRNHKDDWNAAYVNHPPSPWFAMTLQVEPLQNQSSNGVAKSSSHSSLFTIYYLDAHWRSTPSSLSPSNWHMDSRTGLRHWSTRNTAPHILDASDARNTFDHMKSLSIGQTVIMKQLCSVHAGELRDKADRTKAEELRQKIGDRVGRVVAISSPVIDEKQKEYFDRSPFESVHVIWFRLGVNGAAEYDLVSSHLGLSD